MPVLSKYVVAAVGSLAVTMAVTMASWLYLRPRASRQSVVLGPIRKPCVVLVCGAAHSGKSTVTELLVERVGAREVMLARPLKHVVGRIVPWITSNDYVMDVQQVSTPAFKFSQLAHGKLSGREALQQMGDFMIEAMGEDVFTRCALRDIRISVGVHFTVVSDVRKPCEQELLQDELTAMGYEVCTVKLQRMDDVGSHAGARAGTGIADAGIADAGTGTEECWKTHVTEQSWSAVQHDKFILNDITRGKDWLWERLKEEIEFLK